VSLYYADTTAVIKLLAQEAHSKAFAAFYDSHADVEWVSSAPGGLVWLPAAGR
jgi:hypothetical protein